MPRPETTTKKPKKNKSWTKFAPKNISLKERKKARRERKVRARESHKKITGSFRLFADSTSLLRQHWKLFGSIILVYIVLSLVLIGVRGSGLEISQVKKDLDATFSGVGQIGFDLALFGLIVGSSTSSSSDGNAYQPIVFLVISLATVWALRHIMAGKKVGFRDAFYKGMYPLVPVTLVVLVMGLQLIPLLIGSFLFSVGFTDALAVGLIEKFAWMSIVFLLMLASLYMITASIFAFYIATLPDMRPLAALRSARSLVRFRRWTVLRKLLFLPFALLVFGAIFTLPFIWIWPVAAQWVFLLFSMIGLVFAHTYIYSLYRELL